MTHQKIDAADKQIIGGLLRRIEAARDFPTNTDPFVRHVQIMGETLATGSPYPMLDEERGHCAISLLSVVAALYEARAAAPQAQQMTDAMDERCRAALECLPDAPYRAMLARLLDDLRAAAPAVQAPVAWRARGYGQFKTGQPGPWGYRTGAERPAYNNPECCDIEPLYAAAQAVPSTAGVPATDPPTGTPSDAPGAWTCGRCGFRGFWSSGPHECASGVALPDGGQR